MKSFWTILCYDGWIQLIIIGPLPHTVNDFWRMVVETEVQVIVMACNETEAGKHKCERYWAEPEEGQQGIHPNISASYEPWIMTLFLFRLRWKAIRQILCQNAQDAGDLSGFPRPDDAVAMDGRELREGRGADRVPVPLLGLARSRHSDSSKASLQCPRDMNVEMHG